MDLTPGKGMLFHYQGPLDLAYEGFHGKANLDLWWVRILVRRPVAVPPASGRPNGRIQRQCKHSCNHTVRVCFRRTGIDQHTHNVCTALGDASASKLGVDSSVRVDSITDSVWTLCCHSSYPPGRDAAEDTAPISGFQRSPCLAKLWTIALKLYPTRLWSCLFASLLMTTS